MTAIIAINFHYKVIVVADCRVTWTGQNSKRKQDNIQKLYPIDKFGILGFSGDLVPAKAVMTAIRDRLNAAPVGYIGVALAEVISKVSREEYSKLGVEDKGELQLMLAGPLSPIPQVKAENVSMFSVGLFQLDSPYFEMKQLELVARLGF